MMLAYRWMGVGQVPKTTKKCDLVMFTLKMFPEAIAHAHCSSKGLLACNVHASSRLTFFNFPIWDPDVLCLSL